MSTCGDIIAGEVFIAKSVETVVGTNWRFNRTGSAVDPHTGNRIQPAVYGGRVLLRVPVTVH